jgi:hypothetical protein
MTHLQALLTGGAARVLSEGGAVYHLVIAALPREYPDREQPDSLWHSAIVLYLSHTSGSTDILRLR